MKIFKQKSIVGNEFLMIWSKSKSRKELCEELLRRRDSDTYKRFSEEVTGHKTWIWSKNKSQSSVWVFGNEEPATKGKRSRASEKNIGHIFPKSGHIVWVSLEEQSTVTVNWYNEICLPEVIKKSEEGSNQIQEKE